MPRFRGLWRRSRDLLPVLRITATAFFRESAILPTCVLADDRLLASDAPLTREAKTGRPRRDALAGGYRRQLD